jgi:hypothetical protein
VGTHRAGLLTQRQVHIRNTLQVQKRTAFAGFYDKLLPTELPDDRGFPKGGLLLENVETIADPRLPASRTRRLAPLRI